MRDRRLLKLLFELEAFAGCGGLLFSRGWAKKVSQLVTQWSRMTCFQDESKTLRYMRCGCLYLNPNVEKIAHMQKP